ncbi:hypothetical protein SK128_009667 [Halocaridina rubra]|uniref:Uncharacterized protein n=1 Tax=Halocaridina rubra TaxID=373956 RepID=A0AAN8X1M7_HALRR
MPIGLFFNKHESFMEMMLHLNARTTSLLCKILVMLAVTCISTCFIISVEEPLILRPTGQKNTQFGFSLAHFSNKTERWLLVGAPKANTTQVNVTSPGALYSCSIDRKPATCTQLTVDHRNEEDKYKPWITTDHKDYQRLGYAIAADQKHIVSRSG